ncbi:hypothetical protein [Pontiella desulfatans]|nr:hypothetical protein [Pontiella desulfatans]
MILVVLVAGSRAADPDYPYWPDYHKAGNGEIVPQSWSATDHILEGWDWSLPPSVTPSSQGVLGMDREIGLGSVPQLDPNFPVNATFVQWVYWRELEPVEGQIDWQPLLDRIDQCETYGQKIIIRILAHTQSKDGNLAKGHAPQWLEGKGIAMADLGTSDWAAYDPADPLFHTYYTNLIDSLRLSGIPQMDTVQAMYVGYASKSLGDEDIGPHGMDPANEPQHVKERLDAWGAAAAGVEHKIFMGGPSEHGFAKGFGVRRGFVEKYLYTIPDDYIGQQVDADGYLYVDEDAWVIKEQAFNGEVNEEYEEAWATAERDYRFGTNLVSFSYRYFMSNLRLVQMRCTYVHNKDTLMPQLLPWVAQELGRTVEDTPDIWCYLNTSYLNKGVLGESSLNERTKVKNFERWLYQRDSAGYETTPVEPISNEPIGLWMTSSDIDHMAKLGQNIGFAIDDRFIGTQPTRVAVKVSYLDQTSGMLTLSYQNPAGAQQKSIPLTQDGKLKTATFIIDDLVAPALGFDYDITFSAPNEAVLSFLRIIKLEGASNPTSSVLFSDTFDDGTIATATDPSDVNGGFDIAGDFSDPEITLFEAGGNAVLDLAGATNDFPFVAMISKKKVNAADEDSLKLQIDVASLSAAHWWMRPLGINLRPNNSAQPQVYNPGTVAPPLGLSLLIGNQDNSNCRVALAACDGVAEDWLWEDLDVSHAELEDGFTAMLTVNPAGWQLKFSGAESLPANASGSWGTLGWNDIFSSNTYVQCYLREDKNASKNPPQTGTARAEIASIHVTGVQLLSEYEIWTTRWGSADLSNPLADFDNDHLSNLAEYALNGNPTNSSDNGLINVEVDESAFTYVHASNAVDGSLVYRLLERTNLVTGISNTNNWDSQTFGPAIDGYAMVSNHYGVGDEGQRFIQLQVEPF